MSETTQLQVKGLARDPSGQLATSTGSLRQAANVVVRASGVAESRPNFDLLFEIESTYSRVKALTEFQGEILAIEINDDGVWSLRRTETDTLYTPPVDANDALHPVDYDAVEPKFMESRESLYISSELGVLKLDDEENTASGLDYAGVDMVLATDWVGANANLGSQNFSWAYSFVFVRIDANNYVRRSPPSERLVVTSITNNIPGLATRLYLDRRLRAGDQVEVYRTRTAEDSTAPSPEMYLSYTYTLLTDDILNQYFVPPYDMTNDDQLTTALYTNPSQSGILASKYMPPQAQLLSQFKSCAWYARAKQKNRTFADIRSIGIGGPVLGMPQGPFVSDFTIGSPVVLVSSTNAFIEGAYFSDNTEYGSTQDGTYVPALTKIFSIDSPTQITLTANALATGTQIAGMMSPYAPEGIISGFSAPGTHILGSDIVTGIGSTAHLRVGMGWSNSAVAPTSNGSLTQADTRIAKILSNYSIRLDKVAIGSGIGGSAYDTVVVDGVVFYAFPGATILGSMIPVWDWPVRCIPYWSNRFGEQSLASFTTCLSMAINYYAITNPGFNVRGNPQGDTNLDERPVTNWPKTIVFEELGIGHTPFTVDSSKPLAFTPSLPLTATNDDKPNRIYWSALDEPEAVPVINFSDIGSTIDPVTALIPLRNALLVFKTDGVWRVTGNGPNNWNIDPLDNKINILRPEAVAVIDNVAFCWATRGFFALTETSSDSLSANTLDVELRDLAQYIMGDSTTHGTFILPWFARQLVLFGTPSAAGSLETGKIYCFSLVTNAFSEWPVAWGPVAGSKKDTIYFSVPPDDVVDYEIRQAKLQIEGFDRSYGLLATGVTVIGDLAIIDESILGKWQPQVGDMISHQVDGQRIYRRITAVDDQPPTVLLTLEAVFPPTAPINVSLPVISGTVAVGQTVTGTDGVWSSSPTSFTYQWYVDAVAISGATSASYELTAPDIGDITLVVTAINSSGSTPATSNTLVP